ncbi:hypothetical protein Cs7R123_23390 [Catellatospora sp. TT07R-123]|uniref:hypothetical protein n=1 Tax=Catellatospora sp. TT07R-123 TaxID=2733863 RepID=UPI001AFF5BFE|nr:hypothetical protein [Catellatospora sp. TT07R-123]GHJ44997.1 hypothetical protein Cs7R123_23390 [Catellatospora sp. TT07R-123]
MNPWQLIRREIEGARRSVRYDLDRRRTHERTAVISMDTDGPAPRGRRRVMLATGALLMVSTGVGGYYAVAGGLEALLGDGAPPSALPRVPATGSAVPTPAPSPTPRRPSPTPSAGSQLVPAHGLPSTRRPSPRPTPPGGASPSPSPTPSPSPSAEPSPSDSPSPSPSVSPDTAESTPAAPRVTEPGRLAPDPGRLE